MKMVKLTQLPWRKGWGLPGTTEDPMTWRPLTSSSVMDLLQGRDLLRIGKKQGGGWKESLPTQHLPLLQRKGPPGV